MAAEMKLKERGTQMKTSIITLSILVFTFVISLPALASVEEFAAKFQRSTSNADRLQLCADALNHKLIRNGLSASNLKKFFGEDRIADYGAPSYLRVYLSGPYEYAWGWSLFFEIDEKGKISAISLSNITPKHRPEQPTPSRDLVIDLAKRYHAAKTERARFQVCLDAINRGVVQAGAPLCDIKQVFGESWKEAFDSEDCFNIPLSQKSNGWRLYCDFSKDRIFGEKRIEYYYMTNASRKIHPY